jgi:hypothetical protein
MQSTNPVGRKAADRAALDQRGDEHADQEEYEKSAEALLDAGDHCGLDLVEAEAQDGGVPANPDQRDDQQRVEIDAQRQDANDDDRDDAPEAGQRTQKTGFLRDLHRIFVPIWAGANLAL